MDICLIWAHARNASANSNWLATDDLRRFHAVADRHPVLMGRGTYESLPPALLQGRQIFVLTQRKTCIPGAVACTSLHEAFTLASVLRSGRLFLLGGASLCEAGLRVADRLYMAHFEADADEAGAPFERVDPKLFELVAEDRTRTIGPRRLFREYRRRVH